VEGVSIYQDRKMNIWWYNDNTVQVKKKKEAYKRMYTKNYPNHY
jgi:catechol-2,3-dioxygenase